MSHPVFGNNHLSSIMEISLYKRIDSLLSYNNLSDKTYLAGDARSAESFNDDIIFDQVKKIKNYLK